MLRKLMKPLLCHTRGLHTGSQRRGQGEAFGFTVAGTLTEQPVILTT